MGGALIPGVHVVENRTFQANVTNYMFRVSGVNDNGTGDLLYLIMGVVFAYCCADCMLYVRISPCLFAAHMFTLCRNKFKNSC